MKILFAHSFFLVFDEKQRLGGQAYPPLGTLIAAAMARESGHQVALFDAMVAEGVEPFVSSLNDNYQVVVFFEDNFNWLSKMCLGRMRQACLRMIAAAKARGALVVVAGSDASDFPEVFLEAGADYVIKGEAEFRLVELLDHHQASAAPFVGPGVYRLENGQTLGQAAVRGERDLARFPAPAWDLVDLAPYRALWGRCGGALSLNVMTTRGCPYRCNWCAKPIHGRRYDVRGPEAVADELAALKHTYGAGHIWFTDDIFGLKPGWLGRFADAVEARDAILPYMIQARADLVDEAFARDLSRSGCRTVWMGVESGAQKVLDAMDKDLRLEDVDRAVANLRAAGIEIGFFLQFGYPGEGGQEIAETWALIARHRPDQIGISVAYPLPGTPFHAAVRDQLGPEDHWDHSHHMRPIHRASFPAAFYPVLYDYLHLRFRTLHCRDRRGLRGIKDRLQRWRTERSLRGFGLVEVPFR